MEWTKDEYSISTDKDKINIQYVREFLAHSYWAENIPVDVIRRAVKGSLCFSVYHHKEQIGFARVITDEATFAYLADVFIDERFRGRGLSKWLVEIIVSYPGLQGLRRFMLATRDAHSLYEQFGFKTIPSTEPWMQIHRPDVYKKEI